MKPNQHSVRRSPWTWFLILTSFSSCFSNGNAPNHSTGETTVSSPVKSDSGISFPLRVVGVDEGTPSAPNLQATSGARFSIEVPAVNGQTITQFCSPQNDSLYECRCKFSWMQTYNNSATLQSPLPNVPVGISDYNITCALDRYGDIPQGTEITISIIATDKNPEASRFRTLSTKYIKSINVSSNFRTTDGAPLFDIYRYGCYETIDRPIKILSYRRTLQATKGNGQNISADQVFATKFCYNTIKDDSGANGSTNIGNCDPQELGAMKSAQSYYYNLYTPEPAGIVHSNSRYYCPKVEGSPNTQQPYWPLDSSFALSMVANGTFSEKVEAASILGDSIDTTVTASTQNQGDGANYGVISKTIGYGIKPNQNGSCPRVSILNGASSTSVPTYRLRRYIAIYPPTFNTNGAPLLQAPAADVIYVVDRPVAGNATQDDNVTSIRGPKPCPFAYNDSYGAISEVQQGYYSTNDPNWDDKSVDNIHFPNEDTPNSCAAVIPLYNDANVAFATSYKGNSRLVTGIDDGTRIDLAKVYVRPGKAWWAHYEEDVDFQICAPLARPFTDPPLYFVKNSATQITWCAAPYPNWNTTLNRGTNSWDEFPGRPSSVHISNIAARTVRKDREQRADNYPLQAYPKDIFNMLASDPSYSCEVTRARHSTYSVGLSPFGGCCNRTNLSFNAYRHGFLESPNGSACTIDVH